ncbi:hypothetical protein ANSO36C_09490 [Nostoc cf. commune SO-36]|uniref:Uncharacterized protein n=1 Tax=Nostoc cf. commune SO-36 TaxID=449208 RepID=A0ABM7YWY3_NOSCO|nr:hypothetical protein [Nostoc commune]BDI15147.1 hypothetical protein ANSO36C_09490 [Nostoc cf. commune SO-36]
MTGKNVSIEGVVRNTAGDANANTAEVLIAATNNATLMTDIISQGTLKITAGNNIEAYNGQILVQGTGEVLNISQTNANGSIKFGRTILVNEQYQQQGLDLAGIGNVTINGTGIVNIGSGVRIMSSADNSTVNVSGDVINVTGSLLAGASLNNNTVTWTGKTATVNLNATDVVTFGGAGVENGKIVTRGGSAWATDNVNINVAGGANQLDFTMNDLSSIKSDATARFAETGTLIFADTTDSKINITAQGQVEIDGLIQAYDDNADITIDSAGLLLINGYLKADDTLTVDGGTNDSGYGLMLTPLIFRDPQGRLINSSSFYINSNGEYVDANGVKLALGVAPVESLANLTRVSGGTLETAFGGNINISAEAGIVLSGQVAPSNGTTVNPDKISIISENNAGDVFIDNKIGARGQIIIKGKNLYLLDYQETDALKSVRPNNALIQTYGGATTTDPSIQIHGTGKVIIAKSQAPLSIALVDSYKDIEVIADSLWVQGYLDSSTDVTLNVVTSAEINGLVSAAQNLNIRAGINPNWDLNTLRGTVTRSQLSGGNILINGTGTLKANNMATLLAGGTVTISADSALGAGTKPVPIPFITQKAITVPVVTATKPVEDGTIQVEVVNWIPTTVTEQVGVDQVRVGNEFFTMDAKLSQDSYWNPTKNIEREWFVNKVDYNTADITSWSAIKYSTSNKWAYTNAQGKKVETDIADPNYSFNELNDDQKNAVIEYLGYYKLYDFGYSNAKVDRTVNGNPTRTDVFWNLTETTESYKTDSVNGQTYRKEFIGGSDYKQAGLINTIDYKVDDVNWGSAGKPLTDHVFADLTATQKDQVAIYKGYSNYQTYLNTLVNGGFYNSYDVASNPNNIATKIININVDGWGDKYIRVPVGIAADLAAILKTVSQGEAKLLNDNNKNNFNELLPNSYNSLHQWITQGSVSSPTGEYVGYYWNTGDVSYIQAASKYYYPNDDYPKTTISIPFIGEIETYLHNSPHNPNEDGEAYWQVSYVNNSGIRYFNVDERNTVELSIAPEWNSGLTSKQASTYQMDRYTNQIQAYDQYVTALNFNTSSFSKNFSNTRTDQFGFEYDYWGDWIKLGGYWMDNDDGSSTKYDEEEDVPTWGWRNLISSDKSVLDDVFGDGHDRETYDDDPYKYPYNNLSYSNLNSWESQYDQVQSMIEYTEQFGGDDVGGFVRGRNEYNYTLKEDWQDYQYHWISRYKPIYDTRLQLSYQWVSREQDIYDGRPRYETRNIQVKDVSIKTETKFRTENITENQTIWVTERQTSANQKDYGQFAGYSISAANGITIDATGNISITGQLETKGISGNIDITSLGEVNIQGKLPEGRSASDTLAAPSYISAQNNLNITGSSINVLDSSELLAKNNSGQVNLTSTSATGDINFAGTVNAGTQIQLKAGNDLNITGLLNAGNEIIAHAGKLADKVGGNGNITGNSSTYLQTGANGNITMSAGETTGNVDLPSGWLTTGTLNITASQGTINNYLVNNGVRQHGLMTADTINLTAKSGISANLDVTTLNVNNTSSGYIDLTVDKKATTDVQTTVTNNNGNININSISGISLLDVTALGTGNDIQITAGGNVTVNKLKAADQLTLNTSSALILSLNAADDLSAGTSMTLSAGSITRNNNNRIRANTIDINTANGNLDLYTQVNNLSLEAGGTGNVSINNIATTLNLTSAKIGEGNFTLNTSGALIATWVELINNSQARTFNITSSGDMTIGKINAGLYSDYDAQGNLISSSQINLTSNTGAILAVNPNDGIADVVAQKIIANSGKTINFETATETNGLSATANTGDILIERISADDAKTLVLGDLIALQGNVKVVTAGNLIANTGIESATYGSIELVSKTGNIIVTTSTTNPTDKLLKSNTLKLRATQQIIIDDDVTLEGTKLLELAYGKTGILQGSVQLPKIKTAELTLELGSGSIIVSPETFVDASGKAIPLDKVNLIARGNQITEGQFVGYYRYQDSKNTYYLDTAELVEGTKVYQASGSDLVALTAAEVDSLRLAPVLNTISYQLIEAMSGRYVFSGNNGREYYIDGYELSKGGDRKNLNEIPNGTTVYTRQNDAGDYAYTVVDPTETNKDTNGNDVVVGYKVVYSNESDYKIFIAQNPQYKDVQIKFTAVNYASLDLQAKMKQELAGGIQLVTPSGILQEERTGFPMLANSITLKAQRDLGNISFKDIIGTNVEIATGDNLDIIGAPTVTGNLKISSNGYFDDKGNFIGGLITTGKEKVVIDNVITERDVILKASGLELAAFKGINIKTDVQQLKAAIIDKGDITISEANAIALSDVSVKQGNLTISTVDTNAVMTIGKVEAGNKVNITTGQIFSAASDGVVDLTAESLTMQTTQGIGTDNALLETSVKNVSVIAGGGANLSNYGGLTVDSINAGGGVQVETHSPLAIAGNVSAGARIRLQSGDSQGSGDDLTIRANITTISGNITLNSGDNLLIAENTLIATLGEIIIQGDFDNKDFGIGSTITLSGTLKSIGVKIDGGDDSDIINIDGNIINYSATGILTTVIRSQNGNDIINLGDKNKTLNSIAGSIDINTSDDFDTLNIENSGNPSNNNLKVTVDRISGLAGMTGDISYLKVEKININLGSGNNLLNIASNITAEVNVNSGQGQNTILMDYANKTEAFDLLLDNGTITGFTGAGNLEYTNFQAIDVKLGTGDDKFTIKDTSFTQKISVDAGAGYNELIVDIARETNSRNETINIGQNNIFGLGLDQRFKYSGMKEIDVQLGSGADNINLLNDFTGKLNFNTGIGADTLVLEKTLGITNIGTQEGNDIVFIQTIGAATSVDTGAGDDYIEVANNENTVDSIATLLTVSGGEGQDYLIVNDSADSDNSTLTLTNSTIRGLDLTAGINYSQLEMLDVLMGSGSDVVNIESTHQGISYIFTGAGNDTVNVETIAGETNVKLGAGDDTINVGDRNKQLDNIYAALIVSGGIGNNTLNIDDSGDSKDNTAILNDTLLTGLGMNGEINYGNFENLNIKLGSVATFSALKALISN